MIVDAEKAHRPEPWWLFRVYGWMVAASILHAVKGYHADPIISVWGLWLMMCIIVIPLVTSYMHNSRPLTTRMISYSMIVPMFYAAFWLYITRFGIMWRSPEFHLIPIGAIVCMSAYIDLFNRKYPLPEVDVCVPVDSTTPASAASKHKKRKMKRTSANANNNNIKEEQEEARPERVLFPTSSELYASQNLPNNVRFRLNWISDDRISYVGTLSKCQNILESDKGKTGVWLIVNRYGAYLVKSVADIKHVLRSLQLALIDNPFNDKPVVYAREQ